MGDKRSAPWTALPEKLQSDVELDHYALLHLQAFAKQACSYSGLGGDDVSLDWATLLVTASTEMLSALLPLHFEQLSATRLALADARAQLETERQAESNKASKADAKAATSVSTAALAQRAYKLVTERTKDDRPLFDRLAALVLNVHFVASGAEHGCRFRTATYEGHALFEEHQNHGLLDETLWKTIGGTFEVACPKEEVHKVLKPLQLTVFAAIQLRLEAHWLRDTLCTRLPPLPPITPTERDAHFSEQSTASEASITRPPLFSSETQSSGSSLPRRQSERWSRSNLWSVLLGKNEEEKGEGAPWRARFRQSISRGLKKRKTKAASTQKDDWLVVDARPTLLKTMFERTSSDSKDSSIASKPESKSPTLATSDVNESKAEQAAEGRFAKVIARMESTVLSTSTAVRFGPPHLLERLRLQEIQEGKEEDGLLQPRRPTAVRQRSFPTADAETLANSFAESSRPPATPVSSVSKQSSRMAADARAALASLTANNASLQGMIRHQSIQYLIGRKRVDFKEGDSACAVLRTETVAYYHTSAHEGSGWSSDHSLSEWIARLAGSASQLCSATGCEKPLFEHVTTYLHNDSRIELRLSKPDSKTPFELGGEITIWASCAECGHVVRPTLMSAATALMSSHKMLEMLFYDPKMLPEDENRCQHVHESHFAVVRHFRFRDVVVRLQHFPVTLYELRMPTPLADDGRIDDPPSPPHVAQEEARDNLRHDIRKLNAALTERFESIDTALSARTEGAKVSTALNDIRTAHLGAEAGLMKKIRETPLDAINDARYACRKHYESVLDRLAAYESEVLDKKERGQLSPPSIARPPFMQPCNHALPAGNAVIAREDEPASLIAFALSASLFRQEIALIYAELDESNVSHWLETGLADSQGSTTWQASMLPPPNRMDGFEQSVTIEKAENVRQPKSLLALGQRSPHDSLTSRFQRIVSDPVAKAEPVGKIDMPSPLSADKRDDTALLESLLVSKETTPMSRKTSSIDPNKVPKLISALSTPSKQAAPDLTASTPEAVFAASQQTPKATVPRGRPAKGILDGDDEEHDDVLLASQGSLTPMRHQPSNQSLNSQRSIASAIDPPDSARSSIAGPPDSARSSVLSTLWTNASWRGGPPGIQRSTSVRKLTRSEDRKRHIKYTFKDGDKRFTVTAWDAARFGKLRRQCGIREQIFIDSLTRCSKWSTTGGKSKSAFFLTGDKRFVLKQMLDAWTGSERDSMLAFSTDYFRYFQATSSQRPSLIAKLFGVFSIHIKDEKAGDERKLDLVVMENLFAAHAVSHTFDLKGIAARVAKTATEDSVMWDSTWVSRYSNVVLVHAYSKAVITAAVANDAAWLASCGIMDYSALLGISDEEHALIIGIIDVLGSFNLAKYLEHRAKSALRSSGEVTVLPPSEYATRFRRSLEEYIVAVPDAWTANALVEARRPCLPCPL